MNSTVQDLNEQSAFTAEDIPHAIFSACKLNGCAGLAEIITWRFSHRMTMCAATADFMQMKIVFGIPFWEHAPPDERKNTVYHEVCHLIAVHRCGLLHRGHSGEWKAAMRVCGQTDDVLHNVDTGQSCKAHCDCGEHTLGPWQRSVAANGRYRCRKCRTPIKPIAEEVEA